MFTIPNLKDDLGIVVVDKRSKVLHYSCTVTTLELI